MNIPDKCPKCGAAVVSSANASPQRYECGRYSSDAEWVETEWCRRFRNNKRVAELERQRVRYVNALRKVVSRRCPKNKLGVPLVSDFDLLAADAEERKEALGIVEDFK